jgi:simple sugar transport system ATP-binding protein
MSQPTVLEMRGIVKQFPGILANDNVDFDLRRGEVHALLGENGAGKSTLMNILYGLYRPDAGEINVAGKPVTFSSAKDAIENGLGMVHQHFMLIPVMTVAENIVLASEPTEAGVFLDYDEARRRVRELAEQFGFAIDPDARIEDITVGQQQRWNPQGALPPRGHPHLDEPTAVLTPQEASSSSAFSRAFSGKDVDHLHQPQLNEVLEIADRITVLRRGKLIGTFEGRDRGGARAEHGRPRVLLHVEKPATPEKVPSFGTSVCATTAGSKSARSLAQVGRVRSSGSRASTERPDRADRGDHRPSQPGERGHLSSMGKSVAERQPTRDAGSRVGHIPEDRHRYGMVLDSRSPRTLRSTALPTRLALRWLFPKVLVERTRRLIKDFDVRGGDPQTKARNLSGGNQQKLVVAREVDRDPKVLIAAQPTRGLDVGAIEYLHRRLVEERDIGRAVLLVSLELEEVLSLSDRILVMYEGEIVGEHAAGVTEDVIGVEMLGGQREEVA